jgi:hypothetical protein
MVVLPCRFCPVRLFGAALQHRLRRQPSLNAAPFASDSLLVSGGEARFYTGRNNRKSEK